MENKTAEKVVKNHFDSAIKQKFVTKPTKKIQKKLWDYYRNLSETKICQMEMENEKKNTWKTIIVKEKIATLLT